MVSAIRDSKGLDVRSEMAQRWSQLSDRDLDYIGRHAGRLSEALQVRYGMSRDTANAEVRRFVLGVCCDHRASERSTEVDEPRNLQRK